jgi:hypothetical protein
MSSSPRLGGLTVKPLPSNLGQDQAIKTVILDKLHRKKHVSMLAWNRVDQAFRQATQRPELSRAQAGV